MTLPKYVPNIASLGGNYTSGPAIGTPRIVEPSAGDQAAGYVPGDDADAQTVNFYVNSLGKHLEAVVDGPSFDWRPWSGSYANNDLRHATYLPNGNANDINDPPLFGKAADGTLYSYGYDTGSNHYSTIKTRFGQGQGFFGETSSATEIVSALTGNTSSVPGTYGRMILLAGSGTSQIAQFVYIGSGTDLLRLKYSNDGGTTWTGATGGFTTIAALSNSELFCAFQWNGAWYVGAKTGPGPYSTNFYKSSSLDLATATWSNPFFASNPLLANDCIIRRAAVSNSGIMVMVPERDQYVITWDGSAKTQTAFASHDASKTGWRIAWNQNIGLFGLVNLQGDFWTSPDGINWTNVTGIGIFSGYDIRAHGRGFLVVNAKDYVSFFAQDHTQAWTQTNALEPYNINPGNAFHLVAVRGMVLAVRTVNDGASWRYEWYRTASHPLDRVYT